MVDVPNHGTHEQTNTNTGPCTSLLLSEIMSHGAAMSRKEYHQEDEMKVMNMKNMDPHHLNYSLNVTTTSPTSHTNMVDSHTTGPTTSVAVPSPMIHNIQGKNNNLLKFHFIFCSFKSAFTQISHKKIDNVGVRASC